MKLKDILIEAVNLKGKAAELNDELLNGEHADIIGMIIDGSISGERTYQHILDTVDTTKKNYGKRGSNLIAYVGGLTIQEVSGVNGNQALSIWKYLSKEAQDKFNNEVKSQLEETEKEKSE